VKLFKRPPGDVVRERSGPAIKGNGDVVTVPAAGLYRLVPLVARIQIYRGGHWCALPTYVCLRVAQAASTKFRFGSASACHLDG